MIGSPPGRSRWLNLPGLALTNVVPLVLVTQGLMSTADLLLSYLFELYVLLALWWVQRRRPRGSLADHAPRSSLTRQQRVRAVVLPDGRWSLWLSWSVLSAVSWDLGTALAVAAMGISIAVGLVLSLRDAPRGVTTGAWLWRMLLLATGAWVGLGTAENYTELQAGGWVPGPLGRGLGAPLRPGDRRGGPGAGRLRRRGAGPVRGAGAHRSTRCSTRPTTSCGTPTSTGRGHATRWRRCTRNDSASTSRPASDSATPTRAGER